MAIATATTSIIDIFQLEDSYFTLLNTTFVFTAEAKDLFIAAICGLVIGLERHWKGKPASIRTFAIISSASCLYTILSVSALGGDHASPHDITRVAAQIVSGIGFLGAGVIFKTGDKIEGITTAALIWIAAAIGMACGFNRIGLVFWMFVLGFIIHISSYILHRVIFFFRFKSRMRARSVNSLIE